MSSTVLRRKAKDILWRVGNSEISPSIYDTAWACLIDDVNGNQLFPGSLQWIQSVQLPDGSWGSYPEYVHDRVICTMAAIMALQRWKTGEKHIERGLEYILKNAYRLVDEEPTVAFEKILFVLQRKISAFGLDIKLPEKIIGQYKTLSSKKVFLEPHASLLDRAVMHSLELFAPDFLQDMHGFLKSRGQHKDIVGYSPAATAAMVMALKGHPDQGGYIRALKGKMSDHTLPVVSDFDIFETCWAVLNVHTSGVLRGSERPLLGRLKMLKRAWSDQDGVGWAGTMGVKDLDDTAITYFLLRQYGDEPNERVFEHFEAEDHFKCFPDESTASVSHQAHLLLASSQFKDGGWAKHVQEKIISFLEKAPRDEHGLWKDKWNVSEVYATSRVLMAARALERSDFFTSELSLLSGFVDSSSLFYEEASYVSLITKDFVESNRFNCESLWMEKVIYYPEAVVESFVLLQESKEELLRDAYTRGLSPISRRHRVKQLMSKSLSSEDRGHVNEMVRVVEWIFAVDDLLDDPNCSVWDKERLVQSLVEGVGEKGYLNRELDWFLRCADDADPDLSYQFRQSIDRMLNGMLSEIRHEASDIAGYTESGKFSIGAPTVIMYLMIQKDLDYHQSINDALFGFGRYIRFANDLFSSEKEVVEGSENALTFIDRSELKEKMNNEASLLMSAINGLPDYYSGVGSFIKRMFHVATMRYVAAEDFDGRVRTGIL